MKSPSQLHLIDVKQFTLSDTAAAVAENACPPSFLGKPKKKVTRQRLNEIIDSALALVAEPDLNSEESDDSIPTSGAAMQPQK